MIYKQKSDLCLSFFGITDFSGLIPLFRCRDNGIINNGDRRKDEEEKKPSVMEKIQEKKKEAAEAEASRAKPLKREKSADREIDLSLE